MSNSNSQYMSSAAALVDPNSPYFIESFGVFEHLKYGTNPIKCSLAEALQYVVWWAANSPSSAQCVFCTSSFTSRDIYDRCLRDLLDVDSAQVNWKIRAVTVDKRISFNNGSSLKFFDQIPDLIMMRGIKISTLAINDKIASNMLQAITEHFLTCLNPSGKIIYFS